MHLYAHIYSFITLYEKILSHSLCLLHPTVVFDIKNSASHAERLGKEDVIIFSIMNKSKGKKIMTAQFVRLFFSLKFWIKQMNEAT